MRDNKLVESAPSDAAPKPYADLKVAIPASRFQSISIKPGSPLAEKVEKTQTTQRERSSRCSGFGAIPSLQVKVHQAPIRQYSVRFLKDLTKEARAAGMSVATPAGSDFAAVEELKGRLGKP